MSVYLIPIEAAILSFPILAALITIPYILIQYRRYGSILPSRVVIVYSFIFYLLCAYFLVILPLPPMEEVAKYTTPIMQLIPFESYKEFSMASSLILSEPSTYWTALNEPSLFLILFNILLCVPFGIYLHYYFECSWKKTFLYSFLLSLSFECIQLSALFGIYPRPYRLFDVDDLINNTIGGMVGFLISPFFGRFLPTRLKLDEISIERGKQVSSLRRLCAFFIDFLLLFLCTAILTFSLYIAGYLPAEQLSSAIYIIYAIIALLLMVALSLFTRGKSLGKALVKIRLVNMQEKIVPWYQQLLHYGILYLLILPCPYLIFLNLQTYFSLTTSNFSASLWISAFFIILYLYSLTGCIRSLFMKEHYAWYDRRWKLHNISTIPEKKDTPKMEKAFLDSASFDESTHHEKTSSNF